MTTARRRRVRRPLVFLVVLVAGAVAFTALQASKVDPAKITQEQLHAWATSSENVAFGDRVDAHEVIVAKPRGGEVALIAAYTRRTLGIDMARPEGKFDLASGQVEITGNQACYESTLPEKFRPTFYHTLRHEYGHAAFADYMKRSKRPLGAEPYLTYSEPGAKPDTKAFPKAVAPIVKEWSEQDTRVYGTEYLSSTFEEYLAESYARLLEGRSVPPKTKAFILAQYGGTDRGLAGGGSKSGQ